MDLKQKAREWRLYYLADSPNSPILTEAERMARFAAQCVAEEREACEKRVLNIASKVAKEQKWHIGGFLGAVAEELEAIRARKDS